MTRIAVACSGLGHVRRGFETYAEELFRILLGCDELEVTLFRGGGTQAPREIRLWNVPRNSRVWYPLRRWVSPYVGEQITFALALARRLKRQRFDIVHLSDGQLASSLLRLFPGGTREFRIVFTNGGALAPPHYRRFDFIQHVNPVEMDRALAAGLDNRRMILLPHGVSVNDYGKHEGEFARKRLGISNDLPVVLSVGAFESSKRLEFLVREVANARVETRLVVVGEGTAAESYHIRRLASRLMGDKSRFLSLHHTMMPLAYSAADLFVSASLHEGFGLAIVEAMASGLPVIHHDDPGLNWVVGDAGISLDMTESGRLSESMSRLINDSKTLGDIGRRARRRAGLRYSWKSLLPRYLQMYARVLEVPILVAQWPPQ